MKRWGRASFVIVAACLLTAGAARGATRAELDQLLKSEVREWRFKLGDAARAEQPGYDDSAWEQVTVGHRWWPSDSTCWYRTVITVPGHINGLPTNDATIRLKLGVDNGGKVYVDGAFKQEFEWRAGDVVLTEHAKPGQQITVAINAFNRPGWGSLLEASLVSSRSERRVEAIQKFLNLCNRALTDVDYVPKNEADEWRARVEKALARVDIEKFEKIDDVTFLASVVDATDCLQDTRGFDKRLAKLDRELKGIHRLIEQGRKTGLPLAYARSEARVIESFLHYARDDMADPKQGRQIRALKIAEYLKNLAKETRSNLVDCLEDPARDLRIPSYRTGPISIRDGAFWQDGRPIYFTGVGHFGQVRKDLPILNEYGLNIIQIEMGPSTGLPDPDTVDVDAIRGQVVTVLDDAAAHHVAVNLLVSPHYFPKWALDKNPELTKCGHGFMKYCIDAPESRAIVEKWLRALMSLIKSHPALHSICLSNEPQYRGQCRYSVEQYHAWLKRQYSGIEAVNAVYGTAYGQIGDVPFVADRSNYAMFFDGCRFNQDRFLAFHEFERDIIHEYDPDLPVHAKVMSQAFFDPGHSTEGINHEDFNQLGTIAGNDCPQNFNHKVDGEFAQDWQQMAMNFTLQRCTAPGRPIFNSETHLIVDADWRYVPESHIRNVYWMQALLGQGAATTWVWERSQGGDSEENILTRPNCVRALGRVALDLQRLAPEVHALEKAPADAAILYSYSSLAPNMNYVEEATKAFEGAWFTDARFDFITEQQILAGNLRGYKLLVTPNADYAPDAVVAAIQDYLDNGGAVLAAGACFHFDEHARPRTGSLTVSGKGMLIEYPEEMSSRAYREALDPLLDKLGCVRPVRISGPYGEPVWGVNVQTAECKGRLVVNLVNFGRETCRVRIKPVKSVARAINLLSNEEVGLELRLAPLEPLLLLVEPRGRYDSELK